MSESAKPMIALHWFRKGLRLHDNPALHDCLSRSPSRVYPVYVLEPGLEKRDIGINRYTHMLQTLEDLDRSLRRLGSRLFVLQGDTEQQLQGAVERWGATLLTYEQDSEPGSVIVESRVRAMAERLGVTAVSRCGHTLFDPLDYVAKSRKSKTGYQSYGSFLKLFLSMGPVRTPLPSPSALPQWTVTERAALGIDSAAPDMYSVPSLRQMGYPARRGPPLLYEGGETEALARLRVTVQERGTWVARFEKPNTAPNSIDPSTTVLSPYLRHGSLSPALMWATLNEAVKGKSQTQPPVSLHGQLLWREFFYLHGATTPNFDRMLDNPTIKNIPWGNDPALLAAWKEGRTGYPFIDAIMRQLKQEGWIHHLARHAVACFLTRGDLWQHWEEGAAVFEELLLDADWSLNNANWQWLSCSNFYYQYFKCYSPVAFGKKTDPEGNYIKKWVPEVRHLPPKYIYEPFKAPKSVQIMCQCVVGKDYPAPIVDHDVVSKLNMAKMKLAYEAQREALVQEESESGEPSKKRSKS